MGFEYSADAIDYCKRLWLRSHGRNVQLIEKKMHAAGWTRWRAKVLYGSDGWIAKYGFREALEDYLKQAATPTLDSAQELVREIDSIRKGLAREIETQGAAKTDKERLQLHRDYCNLSISALTKVEAARDSLSGWVGFFERLLEWAPDIDVKLARLIVKNSDAFIERAEQEFGEQVSEPGAEATESSEAMNATQDSAGTSANDRTKA